MWHYHLLLTGKLRLCTSVSTKRRVAWLLMPPVKKRCTVNICGAIKSGRGQSGYSCLTSEFMGASQPHRRSVPWNDWLGLKGAMDDGTIFSERAATDAGAETWT